MKIRKIKGIVKDYAWGNRDYIPSLIGGYTGKPQAELWFGVHPSGDSVINDTLRLSELIYSDREYLGSEWDRYHGRLPFLMKVLAIDRPLALQCHPDKKQAEEGWERETEYRKAGQLVSYQDRNMKSEMIMAITPITALCGFRDIDAIKPELKQRIPIAYEKFLLPHLQTLESLVAYLLDIPAEDREAILTELREKMTSRDRASTMKTISTTDEVIMRCIEYYPEDIGCIFPCLMNLVYLMPGEALSICPGILHAYVYGCGIEVMDDSDNVLRCGLTKMRIDIPELKRIMRISPSKPVICTKRKDVFGRIVYSSPSQDYSFVSLPAGFYSISGDPISIVLLISGSAELNIGEESLSVSKGEALIIPAGTSYKLKVDGDAFMTIG